MRGRGREDMQGTILRKGAIGKSKKPRVSLKKAPKRAIRRETSVFSMKSQLNYGD